MRLGTVQSWAEPFCTAPKLWARACKGGVVEPSGTKRAGRTHTFLLGVGCYMSRCPNGILVEGVHRDVVLLEGLNAVCNRKQRGAAGLGALTAESPTSPSWLLCAVTSDRIQSKEGV